MIRDEVKQAAQEIANVISVFGDDVPNDTQYAALGGAIAGVFREALDIVPLSKEDRKKAIANALVMGGAMALDKSTTYSDEVTPA